MKDALTVLEVLIAMPIIVYAAWWALPWADAIYKKSARAAKRWSGGE